MQILQSRNIVLPGGDIDTGDERIALEPSGNFESVDDLRRTVISVPGRSDLLYLEDIVRVERGYVDPAEILVRGNGHPGLALAISLREGGNLIDLGRRGARRIAALEERYPIGIEFDFVSFQPDDRREEGRRFRRQSVAGDGDCHGGACSSPWVCARG